MTWPVKVLLWVVGILVALVVLFFVFGWISNLLPSQV